MTNTQSTPTKTPSKSTKTPSTPSYFVARRESMHFLAYFLQACLVDSATTLHVTAIIQKMLPHFLFRHFFASFFSFEGAVDLLCDHLFLENISKCTQATAHNERTIVCLHYASFLSNIPWVQRWSVTRLLAWVLAGSPHLVLAPIDGLVATPGSSSLTGRVFWLRCFFFFLLQFVKTLSSPFHGSPSLARAKFSNIV